MRPVILFGAAWLLLSLAPRPARSEGWAEALFPERVYDAGSVAKGSKVRHTFRLVNRTDQTVHIASYKPKCGCTKVAIGATEIPPGTLTSVEAVIDTTNFDGLKPSGLTLILDRPSYAEVDLNFTCYIRSDIRLDPGLVDFQVVPRTADPKPTVSLTLTYTGGQPNWGITRMQTRSARVSAKLHEQTRSPGGPVRYLLNATFDPADVSGFFKDEITLFTNDPSGQTIPVAVSAVVRSAVTVSPSPLVLGPVKPGQVVKKTLLVRAARPFKVAGLRPSRDELSAAPDGGDAKAVHTVSLTLKVPEQPGPYNASVEIATDVQGEPPVKVNAFATVVP